ncbi:SDR family NAD(P)-dependent oxidoreductase [Dysgonomonas capnocytophagoides]|uniref:SDR family NAD(P)-dependent oxidoreductase n=1 Tax=Dysgonomonas capnocytophagoides TaxID=45254 RepID=A0A4Y8LCC3_9BACT|nr:SDR family NAD(P)-dependent oxidoreductase [Dysgonomonas capnocytophagoides]TFD99112.1 SDR family NAD(P)-dependent oxidoreductase [Dysgonomonas capnocytophagoides]
MKKIALITGATSGIGKAAAERLAKEGYNLIITGRRQRELDELQTSLQTQYGVDIWALCFDVRRYEDVVDNLGSLPERWKDVDVLINNAGLAVGLNPIHTGVVDDWERMIDTNIKGLLYVTRTIVPRMVERRSGHIVNLGSIAGKEAYLNGNVYCATKHAVDALSKGMRLDLLPYGIKVTQICPGAVETEFSVIRFKGDKNRADQVYSGFAPLAAEDIADVIAFAVTAPDHVNIQDMLIMPKAQASGTIFHKE